MTHDESLAEIESELREQIAQEIERSDAPITGDFKIVNLQNVRDGIAFKRSVDASIARGK